MVASIRPDPQHRLSRCGTEGRCAREHGVKVSRTVPIQFVLKSVVGNRERVVRERRRIGRVNARAAEERVPDFLDE
ncbi:hypothetical protein MGN01_17720 [Methylobacterium gnaphalii]|uniref:Uncharacterized protein n=1 Tax=Methylobacterium gnaphalii TaxID=1010610 RepID=A0A512JIZ3_9HYPH|nr:hypothetical protein MGN01_17720 [Methylobacterium gnaphalii]